MSSGAQIGQIAGGVVGGVLGGMAGNPMLGFSIGMTVGGMAGNAISPTKGAHSTVQGPQLGDLSVQSSAYGGPIPIIYGTIGQIAGNVIWSTPILETRHETEASSAGGGGGKGGPPKATQTSVDYSYSVSMAIGLAAGPIGGVKRIWANGKLSWDALNPVPNSPITGFRLYYGDETQLADPTIEADKGVGNVPAYRGLAYVVVTNMDLLPFNNSVPNLTFELVGQGPPTITTAATYTTTTSSLYMPHCAIDTATGLIWQTYINTGTLAYELRVFRPDTWALVKTVTIPVSAPWSIAYQPGYTLGASSVPARMWVGISNNSSEVYAVDTASYKVTRVTWSLDYVGAQYYLGGVYGPALQSTYGLSVDLSPLNASTGEASTPLVVLTGGLISNGTNPLTGVAGYYSFLNQINTATLTASVCPDLQLFTSQGGLSLQGGASAAGGSGLYIIDIAACLFKFDAEMHMVASYLAAANGVTTNGTNFTNHITYNPDEDCVYASYLGVASGNVHGILSKFDANLALVWTRDFYPSGIIDVQYQRGSGTVWVTSTSVHESQIISGTTTFHAINVTDGTDLRTMLTDVVCSPLSGEPCGFAIPYPNADFMVMNADVAHTKKVPLVPLSSGTTTLDAIVSDLSVRSALLAGDIDVTGLGSLTVSGYMISSRTTVRAAIEPLCRAFFFDGVESDSKVKFALRGGASVATIPYTDIGAYAEGSTPPDPLSAMRTQEADLPNEIEVTYPDASVDYRPVLQYARRLIGYSEEKMSLMIPVVVSASQALLIANVLLYVAWAERTGYAFSATRKYAHLDPGDPVIFLAADGSMTRMRLTKIDFGFPLLLKIEAVAEDQAGYDGFTYAAGVGGYVADEITSPVPTALYLGDWPIFRDMDDNPGFYVVGNGIYTGWDGAVVFRSADGGSTYSTLLSLTSEATVGIAATVLATTNSCEVWDDTHTVDITLQTGSLTSAVDDYAVYLGGNAAMLGSELIQFGTVTSLGSGVYRLSHLLRGRNGTEWAIATHVAGELFVLLTSGAEVVRKSMPLADIGLDRLYKAASPGQYLNDLGPTLFRNTGVGLKPYAPCSVAATRDGSLNLTATWIRRTRIGGAWLDYADVPLGEATESYSIDVMNGATVVRTLTSATPSVAYTAAQQTTDFGSAQAAITLKVYQISASIGRGYAATATV